MNIISVKEIIQGKIKIGEEVIVCGWVKTRRDSKYGFSFISLCDGSCIDYLQIISTNDLINYKTDILSLNSGSSIKVTGIIKKSIGKKQKYELFANEIFVFGKIKDSNSYPISPKKHTVEFLRKVSHLRPRTNLIGAISRIRSVLAQSVHRFFYKENYLWVSTPIITSLDTEGSGRMFSVCFTEEKNILNKDLYNFSCKNYFFGNEVFLTVSGQLNGEAYACALKKIYSFGPVFRAENSNTSRHLSEFWMIEPEIAFFNLKDTIVFAEKMLKYLFKKIINNCSSDLKFLSDRFNRKIIERLENFIYSNILQIDYKEALEILNKNYLTLEEPIKWGEDLLSIHERYLVNEYFKSPLVIKNYPKCIKPFYMRLNDDEKTVASLDIFFPDIGEIIGGSQREERLDQLDLRISEKKLNKKMYMWYRDLRKYGTVPHSGFGVGFDRLLMFISGLNNIRDAVPFPRSRKNASF